MSPSGYEYLTAGSGCGERTVQSSETLVDYYFAPGYPPGQWFGAGADAFGIGGQTVTRAQMLALFGEGRHPRADEIIAQKIADGATVAAAVKATQLGRRFPQYGGEDALRRRVAEAYKQHNQDQGRPVGAPIKETTREQIRDRVHRDAFTDTNHRPPADDTELRTWLAESEKKLRTATAAYELVFAPDKATSTAWALADRPTSEKILATHRQAVRDTLEYFQRETAFTRAGNYGEAQVDTRGITAAIFDHWDNRTGDPHLHSHVVISIKVQRHQDGAWTSLDGRTIHDATVTLSEYYNNRYRDLLRDEGSRFVQRPTDGIDLKRPVWELDGIPGELTRAWSTRTQQVERDRARRIVRFRVTHGREPSPRDVLEISRRAQYGTRPDKAPPRTLAEHQARWRAFADSVVGAAGRISIGARLFTANRTPDSYTVQELAARTRQTVSDYHATFNRWNLLAEAHRQTAGLRLGTTTREQLVNEIADAITQQPDTVGLHAPPLVAEPDTLRRRDGESVFTHHHGARFTTEATLREEANLVGFARQHGGHRLTTNTVTAALRASARRGVRLNAAQQELVTGFARSGRRLQLALAPAGSGKTTAMRVFADAWRSAGGRVYAFGPSARAAQVLARAIDARPHTLHQIPEALRRGTAHQAFPFRPGDVLIIDEAAMSGTHTLHTVVDYAVSRGAEVRLVGDDRQLSAIEAGGAIRLIAHDVGAISFQEVVRFADPEQATASLRIRAGNPAGLGYYEQRGWIADGSIETMRDAAHRAWRADLDAGAQTLLIVPRTDDVVALNLEAHDLRVQRREVDPAVDTQLHDGTIAARGDWIVTRHNQRTFSLFRGQDFVKNGDTWHVRRVHPDGALTVQHREHHGRIRLPADYVFIHVELAYATTIHRAQGVNVADSSHFVVTPGLNLEQFYPSLTRSAARNHAYVVTAHHVADEHRETPPQRKARGVLTGILRRSDAERSATEVLRSSLRHEESLATLMTRYTYAAELVSDTRYRALLEHTDPAILVCDHADNLLRTLRSIDDLGWQAERLVPMLAARGQRLEDAEDPVAVLTARLHRYVGEHRAPPRIAEPAEAQQRQWRHAVTAVVPDATVTDPAWDTVWWHAAAGTRDGLDADAAVTDAAIALSQRPSNDPMDSHRYADHVLCALLDIQRAQGPGDQPALPWLPQHHRAGLRAADDTQLPQYFREMNRAIDARADELRDRVENETPQWAASLPPRPADSAAFWDHAVRCAAAYREIYGITAQDPLFPIGARPDHVGPQSRAWDIATDAWQQALLTPTTSAPAATAAYASLRGRADQLAASATTPHTGTSATAIDTQSSQSDDVDDTDADDSGSRLGY